MYSEAGKGSAPRKGRNDSAYAEGWDRIFGAKNVQEEVGKNQDQSSEATELPGGLGNNPKGGEA